MLTYLFRKMWRTPLKQPYDSKEFGPALARLWENHDRVHGKRYVNFSLHRIATVKGRKRRVNSYGPKDIVSVLGLMHSLCEWYLRDGSTSAEAAKELRAVLDLLGELGEPKRVAKVKEMPNAVSLAK